MLIIILLVIIWSAIGIYSILWHESKTCDLGTGDVLILGVCGAILGLIAMVIVLAENNNRRVVIRARNKK